MKTLGSALLVFAVLCVSAWGHGGTYRGPGTPTGPSGPSTPQNPTGPATGSPSSGPSTGGAADAAGDLAAWQQWWALNRDEYLQLRTALTSGDPKTGTDTFFLGEDGRIVSSPGQPSADDVRSRIVPALLELLRKGSGPDMGSASEFALAKMAGLDTRVAAALQEQLPSANQEIAESAALALGVLGDPNVVSQLVDLLEDTSRGRKSTAREEVPTRTRAFAAYALGLVGRATRNSDVRRYIVHHLARTLEEAGTAAARDLPVACTIALGIVPLEPLRVDDAEAPVTAARSRQVDALSRLFQDAKVSDFVRAHAPVPMARLAVDDPELRARVLGQLTAELAATPPERAVVRQSLITALGLLADADSDELDVASRAALRKHIAEGDRLARRLALIAFARVAARAGSTDGSAKVADESRAFLLGELARGSTPERPWVGLALGILEHDVVAHGGVASISTRAALASALAEHSNPVEAGAYAIGLGLVGGDVGKVLLDLLDDTHDDQVRSYAAVALGMARVRAGIEPLRKVIRIARYRPGLLREVSIGLGLLGDKTVSLELIELLKDAQGLSAQGAIATALGWVGDARAVEPLLAIAQDPTRTNGSRAFSIVALGLICDSRPLPWNAIYAADSNYWVPPTTLFDPITSAGVLDIL